MITGPFWLWTQNRQVKRLEVTSGPQCREEGVPICKRISECPQAFEPLLTLGNDDTRGRAAWRKVAFFSSHSYPPSVVLSVKGRMGGYQEGFFGLFLGLLALFLNQTPEVIIYIQCLGPTSWRISKISKWASCCLQV